MSNGYWPEAPITDYYAMFHQEYGPSRERCRSGPLQHDNGYVQDYQPYTIIYHPLPQRGEAHTGAPPRVMRSRSAGTATLEDAQPVARQSLKAKRRNLPLLLADAARQAEQVALMLDAGCKWEEIQESVKRLEAVVKVLRKREVKGFKRAWGSVLSLFGREAGE